MTAMHDRDDYYPFYGDDGDSSHRSDVWLYVLLFSGLFLCLVGILCCYWYRRKRRRLVVLAPPRSAGSRVNVAFRDAQEGYNQCQVCGFENFKRFPKCGLCGATVVTTRVNASMPASGTVVDGTGYRELHDVAEVNSVAMSSEHSVLTERQRRVSTRKEWMRKMDVGGSLYWYRDSSLDVHPRLPGYTLEFVTSQQMGTSSGGRSGDFESESVQISSVPNLAIASFQQLEPESEPPSEFPTQLTAADNDPASTGVPRKVLAQLLNDETRSLLPLLTSARVADPARMAVMLSNNNGTVQTTPSMQWLNVLQVTSQDFLTKYAHFVAMTTKLTDTSHTMLARVIRLNLLDDSMQFLNLIPRSNVRSSLRVTFDNETGIDVGGLKCEWFELLTQQLCEPASGVLKCVNVSEQTYYLNPNSRHDIGEDHLLYYFATGRLVGRALLEGQVLGFHLALPLIKIVLGLPVAMSDLAYFDLQAYTSMLWIMEREGVESLGLDFSIAEKQGDEMVVVDLIENGRDISVTDENKELYLERRFRYLLFESVSSQLYCFLKGLYEMIPQELLMLFDPEEFDYVLCGSDTIDVDDWERSTKYTGLLYTSTPSSDRHIRVAKWFWEIVREMPDEYRRRLLHFATRSFRVPIAGFSALTDDNGQLSPFTLHGAELSEGEFISSRASVNCLVLPMHESRARVQLALYATLDTTLYGFTAVERHN